MICVLHDDCFSNGRGKRIIHDWSVIGFPTSLCGVLVVLVSDNSRLEATKTRVLAVGYIPNIAS